MKRPNIAKLQKQCDDWNAVNPIGTRVIVRKDVGTNVHTKTRSAAEVLSGHSAVVWLEGFADEADARIAELEKALREIVEKAKANDYAANHCLVSRELIGNAKRLIGL